MRAEVIGLAACFQVQAEARPDGSWEPPAIVTITTRPCWRKPPVLLHLAYAYTTGAVAYYVEMKS